MEHIEHDIIMSWEAYMGLKKICFEGTIIEHWNSKCLLTDIVGVRKIGDNVFIKKIRYVEVE